MQSFLIQWFSGVLEPFEIALSGRIPLSVHPYFIVVDVSVSLN